MYLPYCCLMVLHTSDLAAHYLFGFFVMEVLTYFSHSFHTSTVFSLTCLGTFQEVQHSMPLSLSTCPMKAQCWASSLCSAPFQICIYPLHWVEVSQIKGEHWLGINKHGVLSNAKACFGNKRYEYLPRTDDSEGSVHSYGFVSAVLLKLSASCR